MPNCAGERWWMVHGEWHTVVSTYGWCSVLFAERWDIRQKPKCHGQ